MHLFGNVAPIAEIAALGVPVIEDAAQAAGSVSAAGRPGALGTIATFSFFPSKNLGAFGDGGAITTGDAELADRVRMLRFHGSWDKVTYEHVGYNSRLDEIQAAILRVQLPHLDRWADGRRAAGRHYEAAGLAGLAQLPVPATGCDPAWHLYVVRSENADELAATLAGAGHGQKAYYRTPVHRQPAMARVRRRRRAARHRRARADAPRHPDEPGARAPRWPVRSSPRCAGRPSACSPRSYPPGPHGQVCTHHRDHRPGRLVPRRAAARARLRGPRDGPPLLDREVRAHRAHPRPDHAPSGRPARPALAGRHAARQHAGRDLQPRRDELRRRLLGAADPDRRVHRRRRHAHPRGDARGLPRGALLPGVLERDVRQGPRGPADRGDAVLPALALRRGEGLRALHHRELP